MTPLPTETEIPTPVEPVFQKTINTVSQQKETEGLLHTPKSNARTFVIAGALLSVLTGVGIIAVNYFWKKK